MKMARKDNMDNVEEKMGWLATDKQHGQYAICSVITSQTAYVPAPVSSN